MSRNSDLIDTFHERELRIKLLTHRLEAAEKSSPLLIGRCPAAVV